MQNYLCFLQFHLQSLCQCRRIPFVQHQRPSYIVLPLFLLFFSPPILPPPPFTTPANPPPSTPYYKNPLPTLSFFSYTSISRLQYHLPCCSTYFLLTHPIMLSNFFLPTLPPRLYPPLSHFSFLTLPSVFFLAPP